MTNYRSSIPKTAQERVVSTHQSNGNKQLVEYVLNGAIVGNRWFSEDGTAGTENPLKNGVMHGNMHYFKVGADGKLRATFTEPYRNGMAHGTAKQWSGDGKLIGTNTMTRGTGRDLWRHKNYLEDGSGYVLSEARYIKSGSWHGFEWRLDWKQKSIRQEAHFCENLQHGTRREWNSEGKLRRGFPQYWITNERVTKGQYLRACLKDPNLPPFRAIDNLPQRTFPPEVQAAIEETAKIRKRA
jgi:antitoxin component YwqK of YwqJK toxin-antitoxin module